MKIIIKKHIIWYDFSSSIRKLEYINILGNDYDTEDGTCVCDYVHVVDLVEAHILVREHPQ